MICRNASAALLLSPICARAAASAPTVTDHVVTGGLLQALVGLAVVLALIWVAAWLLRRLQPQLGGKSGALKIVATQSVGQRERIIVVEIAEQWLVVGVAPGRVNALTTIPRGIVPAVERGAGATAFSALVARARGERGTP